MKTNPYKKYEARGFNTREAYLKHLAKEYGVSEIIVTETADALGEDQDFDGLIDALIEIHQNNYENIFENE